MMQLDSSQASFPLRLRPDCAAPRYGPRNGMAQLARAGDAMFPLDLAQAKNRNAAHGR